MTTLSTGKFINIKGSLLDLSIPKVMGIVNLTVDSFYDGGKIKSDKDLLVKVEKMVGEGVGIIDVGAYSSRPGAVDIPLEQERGNATSGVKTILAHFPDLVISIDTFRSRVAESCLNEGALMINDISGGALDSSMFDLLEKVNVPYIMMHMKGNPQTMKQLATYDDMITEIIDYFSTKVADLRDRGVKDIILDPGFGFAKTKEQSFKLLNKLSLLKILELPILCGVSRKSMIFKTLGNTPEEALNGTTALNMVSLMRGASILRVHDVKQACETVQLYEAMKNTESKK